MMNLEPKYQMAPNPPAHMPWEEYEKYLRDEYGRLLDQQSDEKTIQGFLEKHPCMIPGPFGLLGESGHYPLNGTVITQPTLLGLRTHVPDFMWIACDSGNVYPVLIELESPTKTWFTKKGQPCATFTQAINQLMDWQTWFNEPQNRMFFDEHYGLTRAGFARGKAFRPLYLLVYGRYDEFRDKDDINKKRAQLEKSHGIYMTHDRLVPNYKARNLLCSTVNKGKYTAKHVPPTFRLGAMDSRYHTNIFGKKEAVNHNELMTSERKKFLQSRIPYWDNIGKQEQPGIILSSDTE